MGATRANRASISSELPPLQPHRVVRNLPAEFLRFPKGGVWRRAFDTVSSARRSDAWPRLHEISGKKLTGANRGNGEGESKICVPSVSCCGFHNGPFGLGSKSRIDTAGASSP